MPNKDLFVPYGLLEVSRGWQEVVDQSSDPNQRMQAGQEACRELERIDGFYGTNKVLVKSELAILVDREAQVPEAELSGVKFRDVLLKGWLGKATYRQIVDYGAIVWPIYSAQVLSHEQTIGTPSVDALIENPYQKANGVVREPLLLPVGFIDYAICAA